MNLLFELILGFWIIIPAYAANGFAPLARGRRRIDFGKKFLDRREIFGPGKTWEGFWGAGLLTLLSSYFFFSYWESYDLRIWALIALSIWLFGSLGDLIESKLKRSLNIKDSSDIIPGHGGFLDRFDSFIFCIPFVLAIVQILN